jgi:hypothetical protein
MVIRFLRVVGIVAAAFLVSGCRRGDVRLDEVQKMAYGVKPAVVRVNAFATAEFRYSGEAISAVAAALRNDGKEVTP